MSKPVMIDAQYGRDLADALADELAGRDIPRVNEGAGAQIYAAETFREAAFAVPDAGLVLHMSDGTDVHLIIQAHAPGTNR